MRIIYNDGDINYDAVGLLNYINEFTKKLGVGQIIINDQVCMGILNGMKLEFPHVDGMGKSSIFKKTANFLCYFIAERPITSTFSPEAIGEKLSGIPNHQNVIVALQVVFDTLYGASINREEMSDPLEITHRIKLSEHSYVDIVEALKDITPSTHFHLVTILLEQLVYKTNPHLQYATTEW